MTFEETARQLASIGITLDRHQLPDGSFRAYVRKDNINLLLTALTNLNYEENSDSNADD